MIVAVTLPNPNEVFTDIKKQGKPYLVVRLYCIHHGNGISIFQQKFLLEFSLNYK